MEYPITAVENAVKTGLEQLGARPKFWFFDPAGRQCLFKEGRPDSGEDWAEKISCEICRKLGLPHADYDLATYQGKRGVITPNFVPPTGRLVLANEFLARVVPGYSSTRKFRQTQHTIERALNIIRLGEVFPPPGFSRTPKIQTGFDIFVGFLMLDLLVANQDRHHENWGFIAEPSAGVYLAPTFDHGSSLARNETDATRHDRLATRDKNRRIEEYCKKALSGFYEDASSKKPMPTLEAFKTAKRRNPQAAEEWISRLSALDNGDVETIVKLVPSQVMTDIQKEFTSKLILVNKKRILELA